MATGIHQCAEDAQAADTAPAARQPATWPSAASAAGPVAGSQALAAAVGNRAFSKLADRPRRRRGPVTENRAAPPDRQPVTAASSALARAVRDRRAAPGRRVQRARTNGAAVELPAGALLQEARRSPAVQAELGSSLGHGEPLDAATVTRAESLHDGPVPDVRIHRGATARNTADVLGSAALTLGSDILLGSAADRAPATQDWLVAHELAHAIQQGMAPAWHAPAVQSAAAAAEREADAFADAFTDRGAEAPALSPADRSLATKVIWKYIQDIPPDKLLIIDVDDGDFVGGCVRQIVPHLGIKLIQKSPHTQLFNLHIGYMTSATGEFCIFFYESVSGICETKCFPSREALEEAWDEVLEWLKDLLIKVLLALGIVALAALAVILAWLIVEAIAAALAAFAGVLALAAA